MSDFDDNRFSSSNQKAETPDNLFAALNEMFHFTRDVCASASNTKCEEFWSEEDSCLDKIWDGVNWVNPPYKNMKAFIKKAYDERERAVTVCFIPARTNTRWWHDMCMEGEVYFIRGRPKFKGYKHGLPQPLALVVFGRDSGVMKSFTLPKEAA